MVTLEERAKRGYGFMIVHPAKVYRLSTYGKLYTLTCTIESDQNLNWRKMEQALAECANILDKYIEPE